MPRRKGTSVFGGAMHFSFGASRANALVMGLEPAADIRSNEAARLSQASQAKLLSVLALLFTPHGSLAQGFSSRAGWKGPLGHSGQLQSSPTPCREARREGGRATTYQKRQARCATLTGKAVAHKLGFPKASPPSRGPIARA